MLFLRPCSDDIHLTYKYDVEVKRYFALNDIELLRTACSHNSQKHS
jgi:hypothetical protein